MFLRMQLAARGLAAAILLLALPAAVAQAPRFFVQSACSTESGYCMRLDAYPDFGVPATIFPITARSFKFNLPAPGKAQVSLHGSLFCANTVGSSVDDNSFGVIDLVSQIVTSPDALPSVSGPSGMRLAQRMPIDNQSLSTTLNLHSSRVVNYASGGEKTVHFRFAKLRMDQFITCYVYNAAFTVLFLPS